MSTSTIPGYIYGTDAIARWPLSDDGFEELKKTVLLALADQVEDVLEVWPDFVASNPHTSGRR